MAHFHLRTLLIASLVLAAGAWSRACLAWDAPGHRVVTEAALARGGGPLPAWLHADQVIGRVCFQATEPDRWRGAGLPVLDHENNADHFLDVERLAAHGLTLKTLPRFRYQYVAALARSVEGEAKQSDGTGKGGGSQGFDPARVGMLPYAIMEHHAKLIAAFRALRILRSLHDRARAAQLAAARADVLREMGQLSHFVGDAAQPLHTTVEYNGWTTGPNPHGYTTSDTFHRRIDGAILAAHKLGPKRVVPRMKPITIAPHGAWPAVLALIARSHARVRPLYQMDKAGDLAKPAGGRFIARRLADAASVLKALYLEAWKAGKPTAKQVRDFVRYNALGRERAWDTESGLAPSPGSAAGDGASP